MSDCLKKLIAFAKENDIPFNKKDMKFYADKLDEIQAESLNKADFEAKARSLFSSNIENLAERTRFEKTVDLSLHVNSASSIIDNIKNGADPARAVRDFITGGSIKGGKGTNLDPMRMTTVAKADLLRTWQYLTADFKDVLHLGEHDMEIYRGLWELEANGKLPGDLSKEGAGAANAVNGVLNSVFNVKKAFNPFLEKASDYIVKRYHDRTKISDTDKGVWIKDAMASFGDKSFGNRTAEQKQKIFGDIYEEIKAGAYGRLVSDGGDISIRMREERSLVANDWKAAYDYNVKYGHGSIEETVMNVISQAAREVALIEKFGNRPKEGLDKITNLVRSELTPEQSGKIKDSGIKIRDDFELAIGSAPSPAFDTRSKWVSGILGLQYISKGGSSPVRSFSDWAQAANQLRAYNGKNIFENMFSLVQVYAKAFTNEKLRTDGLLDLYMFSHGWAGDMMRDFADPHSATGIIKGGSELMSTLNGMSRHHDSARYATGLMVSRELSRLSKSSFEGLNAGVQRGLSRFGIGQAEWAAIRTSTEDWGKSEAGPNIKMLDANAVEKMSEQTVAKYLNDSGQVAGVPNSDQILQGRKSLAYKIGTLINTHADAGTSTAGTAEKAFLFGGVDPNSGKGIAMRLAAQFKTATISNFNNYRRGVFSGKNMRGDYAGVAQTAIMSAFLYGIGEYAKQMANGKTPESPFSMEFQGKIWAGSGLAGFGGDAFVSAMSRNGISDKALGLFSYAAGPTIGTGVEVAAGLAQAGQNAYSGGSQKQAKNTLSRGVLGMLPFQNIVYSEGLYKYYITNGLKEFLNEGYLSHLEQSVEKNKGLFEDRQSYFALKPTQRGSGWMPKSLIGR